jgi:hypothetical protein
MTVKQRDHRDMTALLDQLDEQDRLVIAARKGMQPERFISELHDIMGKVSPLLVGKPNDLSNKFFDAEHRLMETIEVYKEHPTLSGVSDIEIKLGAYRKTAIAAIAP